jgi:hypothetical protein
MPLARTDRITDAPEGDVQEVALRRRVNGSGPSRANLTRMFSPWLHGDATPTTDSSTPTRHWIQLRPGRIVNRTNLLQTIAFVVCVLFGLALIANLEPANEGVWFWYSVFFRSGRHLYADMHLALQPLYVLETSAFMAVLGKGWLVSRIPAVLHLVAYCLALLLLVRRSTFSDAQKAILLACSFFVSIAFGAIVFGDYHVLADCFMLYSLLALLSLRTSSSVGRALGLAVILGVLSGLSLTTRLNDGAALFAGVFLAIVCLAPLKKLLSLLLFCLATGFTVVLIATLTGDSLHDYFRYSIFGAAGIKGGGSGSVLTQPLRLPWSIVGWLMHNWPILKFSYLAAFLLALTLGFLFRELSRRRGWWQLGLAVLGVVLLAMLAPRTGLFLDNALVVHLSSLLILLAYGLGIWVAARFILSLFDPKRANGWDRREILLLIPLGQMASGSMSSGGMHYSLLGPVGVFIVLLGICSPIRLKLDSHPSWLPRNTVEWLIRSSRIPTDFHIRRRGRWELGLAVIGVVLIAFSGWMFVAPRTALFVPDVSTPSRLQDNALLLFLAGLLVLLAYGLAIWAIARFIFRLFDRKRAGGWDRREVLLLIPLVLIAVGSTSAGTIQSDVIGAMFVFIVVLAICSAIYLKAEWPRDTLFALAILLIVCVGVYRFDSPYSWYTYREKPMFMDRVWYQHPDYGPIYIERDLLQMVQPVCQKIRKSGVTNELLSLPYPGANYFCSIPPWHGYVQTFFDTTSKQTMQTLMNELQASPPKWIFYQRQLKTIRMHEIAYNQGNPLQQRYLDQLIAQKIADGIWRVVYTSDFGEASLRSSGFDKQWDNQWILIQTR